MMRGKKLLAMMTNENDDENYAADRCLVYSVLGLGSEAEKSDKGFFCNGAVW